jgi:hypothetical protein
MRETEQFLGSMLDEHGRRHHAEHAQHSTRPLGPRFFENRHNLTLLCW